MGDFGMADIAFSCKCGKSLVIDSKGGGMRVQCPACAKEITVPDNPIPAAKPDDPKTKPSPPESDPEPKLFFGKHRAPKRGKAEKDASEKQKDILSKFGLSTEDLEPLGIRQASFLIGKKIDKGGVISQRDKDLLDYLGVEHTSDYEGKTMINWLSSGVYENEPISLFFRLKCLLTARLQELRDKKQRNQDRRKYLPKLSRWHEHDKYVLHPEDYYGELISIKSDALRSYIRQRHVKCTRKLSSEILSETAWHLTRQDSKWLLQAKSSEKFYKALKVLHPECTDGPPPGRKAKDAGGGCMVYIVLGIGFTLAVALFC